MPSVADLVEDHLLRSLSDPATYEAGKAMADAGAVTFAEFGPMRVRATVVDDEPYRVDLRVGPGKLAWSCSEPGASRGDFCRHCVAAAIATWRRAPDRVESGDAAPPPGEAPVPPGEAAPPPVAPPPVAPPPPATTQSEEAWLLVAPETPPSAPSEPAAGAAQTLAAEPLAGRIGGVHAILFGPDPDGLRSFFRDVLGLPGVDVGGGWLVFALPPAELAVHPADDVGQQLYLMTDDLDATLAALEARGVRHTSIRDEAWGRVTELLLAGGTELPIYQPSHPRPTG